VAAAAFASTSVACSPDGGGATGFGSATDSATSQGASGSGASDSAGSGSASASAGSTSAGSATTSGGTASSGGSATTGGGPKFDLGALPDIPGGGGPCGCGNQSWSYIWISNSNEHTVSKINTRTLTEEGRYYTRPDHSGNPSRTSVSIDGRAVVVANRMSGVTKIWARPEFCEDKNGNGTIETATGSTPLAFDADECIAWHSVIPNATVQRPVAWTSGVLNETSCEYENQEVWTATGEGGTMGPNYCGANGIWVHRLDGATGVPNQTIHIPENEVPCVFGSSDWGFGIYGGAVDPTNNFWMSTFGGGKFTRVDFPDMTYQVYNGSSYGVTVDTKGRPWVGDSPQRLDPMTGTWASSGAPGAGGSGIAQDLQGRMWSATSNGVVWVDWDTMAVGDTVTLPESGLARGISVDVDGYIWAVILSGTNAYRIDPDTYAIEMVGGLNGPYTYSDMTGGQLSNVTCNPPQG
jgi:streptogramin lyase